MIRIVLEDIDKYSCRCGNTKFASGSEKTSWSSGSASGHPHPSTHYAEIELHDIGISVLGGPVFLSAINRLEPDETALRELAWNQVRQHLTLDMLEAYASKIRGEGRGEGAEDIREKFKNLLGI